MKKIFLLLFIFPFSVMCAAQNGSGFERALQECKDGVYMQEWHYACGTLQELEGLATRMHALTTAPEYKKRFSADRIDIAHLFGNSQATAQAAWTRVLPLQEMDPEDLKMLSELIAHNEPASSLLRFNPGEIWCALLFCVSLNKEGLVTATARDYAQCYKNLCGLEWFPLLMAQDYGEQLWSDQTIFRSILGGNVETQWVLPNALASFVCSKTQDFEINHRGMLINLLERELSLRSVRGFESPRSLP